jgi:hypothetical protein
MGNVSPDFLNSGGGGNYVNGAMKATLAENGVPFAVDRRRSAEPDSAERRDALLDRRLGEGRSERGRHRGRRVRSLPLANDVRERQAERFRGRPRAAGSRDRRALLSRAVTTKSGQKAWSLSTEPDTSPVEQAAAQAPAGDDDGDDGIPY